MICFDAAYVGKLYFNEPDSEKVRPFVANCDGIGISGWTRVEFAFTAHRKFREENLTRETIVTALDNFEDDIRAGRWIVFSVTDALLAVVAREVRTLPASVRLRSGDALQIVCAREHGIAEIYSNDKQLLAAAPHFGLKGVNIL